MKVFNVLLALGAVVCFDVVSAHKKAKLAIGGAVAGGAGAIGAGGGFLAGSHIGSILHKHGYGLHGGHGEQVWLPPKHVYLKHHEPIIHHKPVEHLHAAPAHAAPIAVKHEVPILAAGHDHHHHHHHIGHEHHHIEHEHHHEHHHAIEHGGIPHAAHIEHAAPIVPIAEHGHFHAPAPHIHHVEHGHGPHIHHVEHAHGPHIHHVEHAHGPHIHHVEHAHGPHHIKKPEPHYKGNIIIKKKIPVKGHHFSIHGYQFSIGRKPKTLLHKKHFFHHPAPVIVKPFFVKEKAPVLIKAAVPVPVPVPIKAVAPAPAHHIEHGPIVLIKGGSHGHGPAAGPWAQGPIFINEGPGPIAGPQPVIKEAAAPVAAPIIKEAVVEGGWPGAAHSGGEGHAPLIKILGPIFDAPLPVIGGHDAW